MGVRNARIVLIDPHEVRAVMTASWLVQMGWEDVYVLERGLEGWDIERGPRPQPSIRLWVTVSSVGKDLVVIDLSTSLQFRKRHIPGAWWAVRSRLAEARAKIGAGRSLMLTSQDERLAHLAAPEAQALWPDAEVRVLEGGNAAWKGPTERGLERATTAPDDIWYKPYDHDHGTDYEKHARDYLTWEVALLKQIKRDPTIRFRAYR
jgi:rhodanese-related sulfurtransferase